MRKGLLLFLILVNQGSRGQGVLKDSAITLPFVQAMVSYQIPEADLTKRFGPYGGAGGAFMVKTKGGFMYGIEGMFLSGRRVKEEGIIDHLLSDGGFVISSQGLAMDVFITHRGFNFMGRLGYMLPVLRTNANSGPFVSAAAGFWQHRVRLEQKYGESTGLSKPYRKGYDRLSNGFALNQMIGYQVLSTKRLINFFIAAEITEGFLQGRRDIIFDTGQPGTGKRFDMAWGVRAGWAFTIYRNVPNKVYYY